MRDGDSNTKSFHVAASFRKHRNKIEKLKNDDNITIDHQEELCQLAKDYFANLLSSSDENFSTVTERVQGKLSDMDNQMLLSPFTKAEFRVAVFDMNPSKAPGLDGLNPAFC